jgi:hypothetical protein
MISRLALGTVQFGLPYGVANQGGRVQLADAAAILADARAGGLDTLDTAVAYGESEACLGAIGVGGWRVISKLPTLPDDCHDVAAWVDGNVAASCSRLGIDRLHGLLLHNPLQLLGSRGADLALGLRAARANGLVGRIGVSIYAPRDLEAVYSLLLPELVQAPLSLVDRRLADTGWLKRLADDGVEVHTRSSFLQGLLLMPHIPPQFAPWESIWKRWNGWLAENPGEALSACLTYPLSFNEVHRVTVGVDSLDQLVALRKAENRLLAVSELPDLSSTDDKLINPANWIRGAGK